MKLPVFKHTYILLAVLAGTLLRLFLGLSTQNWLHSPDQLAWQAELDELLLNGNGSYKQLIHYPHEGGSFFVSLLALGLSSFKTVLPSLSIAALFLDTLVRYLQIRIVKCVFGDGAAWVFALFSILSLPSLLPWATVNFGLHAISSVFPFLLLYFAVASKNKERSAMYSGLLSGIAISFAFDNIVLVPAYLLFLLFTWRQQTNAWKKMLQYSCFTLLAFLPYLTCRIFIDQSFAFEASGLFSGRDLLFNAAFSPERLPHLYEVWFSTLPASFFLSAADSISPVLHMLVVLFFLLPAFFFSIRSVRVYPALLMALLLIVVFVLSYSLSPVYASTIKARNYVEYRHLSYILPFLIAFMLALYLTITKTGLYICLAWILVCGVFSVVFINNQMPAQEALYKPAGWILAKKYGDTAGKLIKITEAVGETDRAELKIGFGWGISAGILHNKKAPALDEIQKIRSLYMQFPPADRAYLLEGIRFSFDKHVTPKLDTAVYSILKKALETRP